MPEQVGEITELLHRWRQGSAEAENELFERLNNDLRRLAHYLLKGERRGQGLQATELVDQIYLRLITARDRDWQNRQHFFAIAARAMRRHLIDQARAQPDAEFVGFEKLEPFVSANSTRIGFAITVGRLLDQLAEHQPQWCQLVELKFFLGLTDEEATEIMGLKLRTTQRMWRDARQWLFEQMQTESSRAANSTGR